MHVDKIMHMGSVIHCFPGLAQLHQRIRPETGKQQHATGLEYARHFGKSRVRLTPLQGQTGHHQIKTVAGEWQGFGVATGKMLMTQPAGALFRHASHAMRQIKAKNTGLAVTFLQRSGAIARAAPQVQYALRLQSHEIEPGEQLVSHLAL